MNPYEELQHIVRALDARFPGGTDIFQRVSRLAEETGELASAINHREGMGIKKEKYGKPTTEHLVKEIQDVMRAAMGIAQHYGVEHELEVSITQAHDKLKMENRSSDQ